jgi:hypothetical protein
MRKIKLEMKKPTKPGKQLSDRQLALVAGGVPHEGDYDRPAQ